MQKSGISITIRKGMASKGFRSSDFPGQYSQVLVPDCQAPFARLGKTRRRKGRIPTGKVKLPFKLSKVPPKSLFPGWA